MSEKETESTIEARLELLAASDTILTDDLATEFGQLLATVEIDLSLLEENATEKIHEPVCTDHSTVTETDPTIDSEQKQPIQNEKPDDIRQIILKSSLPRKIKLALLGNSTCRSLLIRDSNKMIQQFVLKNPKLQASEVEEFAKNPNLSGAVLKTIANNAQWMKSYSLKYIVVSNPKMPQDVSIRWVKFLNIADLKKLAKSKNVPNVVSLSARKRLADMDKKK